MLASTVRASDRRLAPRSGPVSRLDHHALAGAVSRDGIELVAVWALFDRFGDLRGWSFGEVAVFYGLANIMFALADLIAVASTCWAGSSCARVSSIGCCSGHGADVAVDGTRCPPKPARPLLQGLLGLVIATRSGHVEWSRWPSRDRAVGGRWRHGAVRWRDGASGNALFLDRREPGSRQCRDLRRRAGCAVSVEPLRRMVAWHAHLRRALGVRRLLSGAQILERPDPLGAPVWLGRVSPVPVSLSWLCRCSHGASACAITLRQGARRWSRFTQLSCTWSAASTALEAVQPGTLRDTDCSSGASTAPGSARRLIPSEFSS